jgi:hypothetical protein
MAWKEIVADPANKDTSPDFTAKEKIILANNTILDITEEDIVENGLSIEDGTTEGNVFSIGAAKIEKHMLYLNNIEDKFSSHNFTGAVLYPQIGLRLPDTIEWLKKGVFTVDKSVNVNGTIAISAYDNMNKFEKPFSGVPVSFPVTAFNLLYAVCLYCGVSLATLTFMNKDFIINRKPTNELITCRQIVAWIAQLSCNYARCNVDGAMELKWYDTDVANLSDDINGGTFDSSTPYATGDNINGGDFTFSEITNYSGGTFKDMERYHHIYAMEQGAQIETDDIIITGVKVRAMGSDSDYGETVMYGTDGYVIEIKDNPLIQENTAAIIANSIGPKIVGVHFRPLSVSAAPDPCREAGDVANVSDQDGNYYFTIINNLSMTLGKNDRISCNAESTNSNNTSRPSPLTQVLEESKKYTKQNISAYDIAVKQLNSLMINALGYYPIQVKQDDGSYIDYMCDKPTLAESKIIWKKTIDAYAVSTDGGITWNVGITKDGNIIAQTLAVVGINANWIIAGELKSANGATRINLNDGTFDMGFGSLIWDGAEFAVVGKVTANRGKVGPYNIDESGLWSDAISILESDRMPYVWLNQVCTNRDIPDTACTTTCRCSMRSGS